MSLKPKAPVLTFADDMVARDFYRRLRERLTVAEKTHLLGGEPDPLTYRLRLLSLAEKHGI
jgi:hypothetical protein